MMRRHCVQILRAGRLRWWLLVVATVAVLGCAGDRPAPPNDGLHDPLNPSLRLLQDPSTIIAHLPKDTVGTGVDWKKALEQGAINPRTNIWPDTQITVLDQDVVRKGGGPGWVVFPHKPHTQWLVCSNCHEDLFKSKAGATPMNMLNILNGESCGVCHGAVAFPLTECKRCHSVQAQ